MQVCRLHRRDSFFPSFLSGASRSGLVVTWRNHCMGRQRRDLHRALGSVGIYFFLSCVKSFDPAGEGWLQRHVFLLYVYAETEVRYVFRLQHTLACHLYPYDTNTSQATPVLSFGTYIKTSTSISWLQMTLTTHLKAQGQWTDCIAWTWTWTWNFYYLF